MTRIKADLGPADVHYPAPLGRARRASAAPASPWPGFGKPAGGKRTAKPLSRAKQSELPNSQFALPNQRKYPIHDAAHARNAMARLEQNKDRESPKNYKTAKANIQRAYQKFGIKSGESEGGKGTRATIRTAGLSIHVRHMRDTSAGELKLAAVELSSTACGDVAAGETPKAVWNQIAKIGQWLGHPAGPFRITSKEVGEIIRNFRAQVNQKIPVDFEHASEADPTSGTIPGGGAPAQGWIIDLDDRGPDGLWGLIEWGELAREYITAKPPKYRYFSPAIRFNSKDRVTAQNTGARMTSGALTNTPFLDGMAEMAASDKQTTNETTITMGNLAHKPEEYMPRVRAVLGMDMMATARECMERVCRLEELHGKLGSVGVSEGIDLNEFLPKMRDLISAPLGCTWEDVFAAMKGLIGATSGEFVTSDDEEDVESSVDMSTRTNTMATEQEIQLKLTSAETLLKDANTNLEAERAKVTRLTLREAELMGNVTALSAKVTGLETQAAQLTLQLTEATTKLSQTQGELTTLREAESKRILADQEARVDGAIAAYGQSKGLKPELKPTLLTLLKADPQGFDALYPPVAPHQRYLLSSITNVGQGAAAAQRQETTTTTTAPKETAVQLRDKYRKEGMSLEDATIRAHNETAARR